MALIGIVPVANHITGDVELVTRGAERIAQGDLTTRLPVHSQNEIGQLANAFNRKIESVDLYRYPTISALAKHLSNQDARQRPLKQVAERARKQKEVLMRRRMAIATRPK